MTGKADMRTEMPELAKAVDFLRSVFGAESVDLAIRQSLGQRKVDGRWRSGFEPLPTFWGRETSNGLQIGTPSKERQVMLQQEKARKVQGDGNA